MVAERVFKYQIDGEDRIISANEDWFHFAEENGAGGLKPEHVLGRSLWGFISDRPTAQVYMMLTEGARQHRKPVVFPYRCDSPDRRRYMELRLSIWGERGVEFNSRILHEQERERVRLLEEREDRSSDYLVICSWCKKAKLPGARWLEVEEAVRELQLFHASRLPQLTHGMCHSCGETCLEMVEREFPGQVAKWAAREVAA